MHLIWRAEPHVSGSAAMQLHSATSCTYIIKFPHHLDNTIAQHRSVAVFYVQSEPPSPRVSFFPDRKH